MKYRNRVLGLLSLLLIVTYLDRVCISVAGPRMQEALHIGPAAWGWVTGIFTLSYAVFEIPAGALGDRIGARRVLTRIVLWWSAFTSLTGLMTSYYPLLATRFLFGMGEAGAYPNAAVVVSRWFPVEERSRAFGLTLMSAQIGGAVAPLLVVPIQMRYGWRASFYCFGILGVIWSAIWYGWYRDSPAEKPGVSQAELEETRGLTSQAHQQLPWAIAVRSRSFWALMGVAACYVYTFYFFQSWFHTYLVKAHGYSENDLLLSSLPFAVAALANGTGGFASNALVRRAGGARGRCLIGAVCLAISALGLFAVMFTHGQLATMILLSMSYASLAFQQPVMFAACLDIGGSYAGALVGAMNASSQVGSFLSSVAFGYLVVYYGSYNAPFLPMIFFLAIGAWLWTLIDTERPLITGVPQSSSAGDLLHNGISRA